MTRAAIDGDSRGSEDQQEDEDLQDWRDEVYDLIRSCAGNGGSYLIPVLMMLGKTYSAGNLPADSSVDRPVTALTKQISTREDIKDEALDAGLSRGRIKILPSFFETCPTADGDYDEEGIRDRDEVWSEFVKMLHRNGVTPSYMHKKLGDAMPCQRGDGSCPYTVKCDFSLDGVELLIGHPVHANVERYVDGRITLFDEDSGEAFEYTVEQDEFTRAIHVFLEHHVDLEGASSVDDLISASGDQRSTWVRRIRERGLLVDPEIGYSDKGGRADAPLLSIAVLCGEYLGDPSLNLRRTEVGDITLLYDEGTDTDDPAIVVRNPPDPLASAWSVLAMDGTPTREIWCNRLGMDLDYEQFMTDDERTAFVDEVLNYNIVQLTPNRTVSASRAKNVNKDVFDGILREIMDKHERMVPTITSREAKEIIKGEYVSNKEVHLGKVRSRSELEEETLLAILGSLHPGNREIQRLAALDGYSVKSNGKEGIDKSYGEVGDRYYRHLVHHEVAQAIFRVGRTDDCPGADIYVYTANIPGWIPRTVVDENPNTWPKSREPVARFLENRESVHKKRIANEVSYKERTVHERLKEFRKQGYVDDFRGEGRYAKKKWTDTGLSDRNPHAQVTLPDK